MPAVRNRAFPVNGNVSTIFLIFLGLFIIGLIIAGIEPIMAKFGYETKASIKTQLEKTKIAFDAVVVENKNLTQELAIQKEIADNLTVTLNSLRATNETMSSTVIVQQKEKIDTIDKLIKRYEIDTHPNEDNDLTNSVIELPEVNTASTPVEILPLGKKVTLKKSHFFIEKNTVAKKQPLTQSTKKKTVEQRQATKEKRKALHREISKVQITALWKTYCSLNVSQCHTGS